MLVTAATDLQKDIVEGGRVSDGSELGSCSEGMILHIWSLPAGRCLCDRLLCQKLPLDRRTDLCLQGRGLGSHTAAVSARPSASTDCSVVP